MNKGCRNIIHWLGSLPSILSVVSCNIPRICRGVRKCTRFALVQLMADFHRRVQVRSVWKGVARFAFPLPKVGVIRTEPCSSCSTPPLGYWDAWKGTGKFELHTPSIDWSTESNRENTVPARYFWTTAKALFRRKCCAKVWRPTMLLFVHCVAFLFFLGFINTGSGCYWTLRYWLLDFTSTYVDYLFF